MTHWSRYYAFILAAIVSSLFVGSGWSQESSLNEVFLKAVESADWAKAIESIDQIVKLDPSRRNDLLPRREKYRRRLEIEQKASELKWQETLALLETFLKDYPEEGTPLGTYKNQVTDLASIEKAFQEKDFRKTLDTLKTTTPKYPSLANYLANYRNQVLSAIPQPGTLVSVDDWAVTVTQIQDVSQQNKAKEGEKHLLIQFTVRNQLQTPLSLDSRWFGVWNEAATYGSSVADGSSLNPQLKPLGTSIQPGQTLQTGLVFAVPSIQKELMFSFGNASGKKSGVVRVQ
jgi:hypothetical protein